MKYILKIKWEILIVLQLLQNLPNINKKWKDREKTEDLLDLPFIGLCNQHLG